MKILTYVHWRDACTEEAADPNTPLSPDPLVDLYEVGWLIAETDDAISLSMEWVPVQARNITEPGGKPGRFRLHIPKVNIVERRNFETGKMFADAPKRARRRKAE